MAIVDTAVEAYALERTRPESELLQELATETRRQRADAGMLCDRLVGRTLQFLVRLLQARRCLEIGMFTGYSALSVAEALPEDGEIICCDINHETAAIAQDFYDRSPHGKNITVQLAPALETLASLNGPFDFAFIDADKEHYLDYYAAVVPLMRSGGIIAVDNTLWHGAVLEPQDSDSKIIDALNRKMESDPRVDNLLLSIRDGLHLAMLR